MRGVYTIESEFALSTAKTLILLENPATCVMEILECKVTNSDIETNEQMNIKLTNVTTKGSPTGTALTAQPTEVGDQASGTVTPLGNLTGEPTTYDTQSQDIEGSPSLGGYVFTPIPELRPIVQPSGLIGLRSIASVTAINVLCMIKWREIG